MNFENGKDNADLENQGFWVRLRSFVKSLRNVTIFLASYFTEFELVSEQNTSGLLLLRGPGATKKLKSIPALLNFVLFNLYWQILQALGLYCAR